MAGHDSVYDFVPIETFRVMCPHEFDLSGSATSVPIYITKNLPEAWGNVNLSVGLVIMKWWIIYTEASSADAGVGIYLGNETNNIQNDSVTSAINQSQWDVTEIAQATLGNELVLIDQTGRDMLMVSCAGGKTGAGAVRVGVELSRNYSNIS